MKVLGIDIGTATTGWAVLESTKGIGRGSMSVFGYGIISTDSKLSDSKRLKLIYDSLEVLIDRYKPEHLAVEKLFFHKNKKTVIEVGQARGVVVLAGETKGLGVFNYTPLQVKSAVTGYGKANKIDVQKMVAKLLGLASVPKPDDAADALAVCVCHLNSFRISKL